MYSVKGLKSERDMSLDTCSRRLPYIDLQPQTTYKEKKGCSTNRFYITRTSIPFYSQMNYADKTISEFKYISRANNSNSPDYYSHKRSLNLAEQYPKPKDQGLYPKPVNDYQKDYPNIYMNRKFNCTSLRDLIYDTNQKLFDHKEFKESKNLFNQYKGRAHDSNIQPQYVSESKPETTQNANTTNHKLLSSKYKNLAMIDSDIFNQHKVDNQILKKSGEKSTLTNMRKIYSSNTESNSEWIPSPSKATLFNHTNQFYHILNPLVKTTSSVRDNIESEEKTRGKLNHRQKAICEFDDIQKRGSPNKDFVTIYKTKSFPFNKSKNLCSDFAMMSHYYKDLCGPSFTTKKS